MSEHDDDFSAGERRALALWQAPEAPDDFGARVLARAQAEGAQPQGRRQLAAAALALVLVGGFFAARLFSEGRSTLGGVHVAPEDGGSAVEASPLGDGVRS